MLQVEPDPNPRSVTFSGTDVGGKGVGGEAGESLVSGGGWRMSPEGGPRDSG